MDGDDRTQVVAKPVQLAARLEFEMFDRVGYEHRLAVDPGLRESIIENASGRTDEGLADNVFLVARLFADQHEPGLARALANHLGGEFIERAAGARGLRPLRSAFRELMRAAMLVQWFTMIPFLRDNALNYKADYNFLTLPS
jgi:hypothetical protein